MSFENQIIGVEANEREINMSLKKKKNPLQKKQNHHHHTIIRAAFVCVCVCSLSPPRSFHGSSPNLVAVCRWTSHLPLRGSFSKRSTGRWVNGSVSLSTILYAPASRHTAAKGAFCFAATASKSLIRAKGTFCCTASRRVVGVCRWISELPSRGSFSKRSTGRRVNRSTGQRVTFSDTILYMIADDTTLSSLRPHYRKKHTASFARLTGKFPSRTRKRKMQLFMQGRTRDTT